MEGWRPLPGAIEMAAQRGIDLRRHRSRALRSGCLLETDLVVGFESSHVGPALRVGGAAPERVFLLLELPALLDALPRSRTSDSADAPSVIRELHRLRTAAGPRRVPSLPDPLGEPEQVLAETARVIDVVTGALAAAVVPNGAARLP
jgi:protein-tyrosine-phosphatase